ncbi:MAG TPA: hypothetical protein VKZ59_10405 [Acidobacteriota bacterium]|nr:hypothetical protein [Acidobacteriota bacterium]
MLERVQPIQLIEMSSSRRHEESGERRLLVAILMQAMRDFIDGSPEAAQWFLSDERSPGSLRWICDILEIDHQVFVRWVREVTPTDSPEGRYVSRRLAACAGGWLVGSEP